MKGKTILMYLADGEPTGLLVAEIRNWTGKVLVAPRSQLDQLSKREELRRTGVYLLVGPDPDDPRARLSTSGSRTTSSSASSATIAKTPRTSGSARS